MLTVRRLPRTRAEIPALLASLESTAALALAHVIAGGAAPSLVWLAAFGVLGYGAGLAVLTERASIRVIGPVLLATQVLGHAWLVALSPGHGDGHLHAEVGLLGLNPEMLAAHVLAALVAAGVWVLRRRAVELVLHWADPARVAVPEVVRSTVRGRRTVRQRERVLRLAPTRGPPLGVATA